MPALKASADNPEGPFTSAAAEAGPEGEEDAAAGCCSQGGSLDFVSATTLLTQDMCRTSKVYSAM
jgi:hypothetical protein